MELGTNPFWNARSRTRGSLQSLPPRPCRSLGSSCGYSALTPAEKLGGQTMDCKSLGCQGPQGVSEPSSYSSHEFSPGFSGICPGRPERLQRRSNPNFPRPHASASSCSEFKTPLSSSQNLLFQPDLFLPCQGLSDSLAAPQGPPGAGDKHPKGPRRKGSL